VIESALSLERGGKKIEKGDGYVYVHTFIVGARIDVIELSKQLDGLGSVEFDGMTELFEPGEFEGEGIAEGELLSVEECVGGGFEVLLTDRQFALGVIEFNVQMERVSGVGEGGLLVQFEQPLQKYLPLSLYAA
jgi:hypothetical protein